MWNFSMVLSPLGGGSPHVSTLHRLVEIEWLPRTVRPPNGDHIKDGGGGGGGGPGGLSS